MGICKHCGITVNDTIKICPICSHSLEINGNENNTYPEIFEKLHRENLTMRIFTAAAFATCILLIFCDYHFSGHLDWSIIGITTLIFGYHTLHEFLYLKRRLFTIVSGILFRLAIVLVVFDFELGFTRWSLDYALALLLILENINLLSFVFFDKRNRKSYVYYDIWVVLSNIGLLILQALNVIRVHFLVTLSLQISVIVFFSLLIIGGLSARREIARRWHIKKK